MKYLILYLVFINIVALIVTVHDKNAAERRRRRVSERMLFFIAVIGGGPVMYLTMLIISHKTRKKRFMLGIPIIVLIECAVILLVLRYGFGII